MSFQIEKCLVCSAKLPSPVGKGRRRLYCSDACRVAAQRARKRAVFVNALAAETPLTSAAIEAPDLLADLIGRQARNPDEAVLASLLLSRSAATALALAATKARPEFAWRCTALAQLINDGLCKQFEV